MEKRGIRRGCASPRPLSATHVADRRPQPRATKSQEPSRGRMASVELDRMGDPPPAQTHTQNKTKTREGGTCGTCVSQRTTTAASQWYHRSITVVSQCGYNGIAVVPHPTCVTDLPDLGKLLVPENADGHGAALRTVRVGLGLLLAWPGFPG